jgi:hypothetical protein
MFLALVLAASAAPVPPAPPAADWKPAVKARAFEFDADHSGPLNSVAAAKKAGIAAEFQQNPNGFGEGEFTFQKKDGPKIIVSGHFGTSAVVHGDALYVADFSPLANGCKVVAYDLMTGKKAWSKPLAGIGEVAHSKYRNRVAMSVEKHPTANHFALVIVGWESSGRYVEVLDLATSKQLAHRMYDEGK